MGWRISIVGNEHGSPSSIDWRVLLPRLVVYARLRMRRMGWLEGRDEEPSAMSAKKLVNMAILSWREGGRRWDPGAIDFEGFLRGVIRSIASTERRALVRREAREEALPVAPPPPTPEDEAMASERDQSMIALVESCVGDDDDLQSLWLAILDDNLKREDIAAALAWPPERVTAARVKLRRRLDSAAPEHFRKAVEKHARKKS